MKWDFKNKKMTKFSDTYKKKYIGDFGMVYNDKQNCLLIFGGYDVSDGFGFSDYILEFNITTKQWNKMPVSLPKPMARPGCTMAINNTYVLLFGGHEWSHDYKGCCDDIYMYSIKKKTIQKSNIKCPSKSSYSCITVNDNIKDEKLVFGYVRDQWKMCSIDDHYFPPCYLLKIMHSFYLTEFVYCLAEKHYKISTLDIV
eukprot:497868_1